METIQSDFTPGTQLLVDHRGGKGMRDPALLEQVMREATADQDVITAHFAKATDRDGVSGVLLLSQGHLVVQTWADENYASFDLLIPGEGRAKQVADHIARSLLPDWTQIKAVKRNDFTPLPPAP